MTAAVTRPHVAPLRGCASRITALARDGAALRLHRGARPLWDCGHGPGATRRPDHGSQPALHVSADRAQRPLRFGGFRHLDGAPPRPARLDRAFGGALRQSRDERRQRPGSRCSSPTLFLRHVPQPKMLIFGLDATWCEADADAKEADLPRLPALALRRRTASNDLPETPQPHDASRSPAARPQSARV